MKKRKVIFVTPSLKEYRKGILDVLYAKLTCNNIDFRVLTSHLAREDIQRGDNAEAEYQKLVGSVRLNLFEKTILFQNVFSDFFGSDLIILTEGQSNVHNLFSIVLGSFFKKKIIFFGHGKNFQSTRPNNSYKKWLNNSSHGWLTYTDTCKVNLVSEGFREDRIQVFNNSIDTSIYAENHVITEKVKVNVCFLGSLHSNRNIPFLAEVINNLLNLDEQLFITIIGSGTSERELFRLVKNTRRVVFCGYMSGEQKAVLLSEQSLMICPDMLGLNVVDAIHAGVPVVTRHRANHSPEVDYLSAGTDSVFVDYSCSAAEFASQVVAILNNELWLNQLTTNILEKRRLVSGDLMVNNLEAGILGFLND
jgi:L-malate glycosyltransferase